MQEGSVVKIPSRCLHDSRKSVDGATIVLDHPFDVGTIVKIDGDIFSIRIRGHVIELKESEI